MHVNVFFFCKQNSKGTCRLNMYINKNFIDHLRKEILIKDQILPNRMIDNIEKKSKNNLTADQR